MIERIITSGVKGCVGYREAVARMPDAGDVAAVAAGGQAPDCFGKLALVTRVAYRGTARGRHYVHYVCALVPDDTVANGCGCSNGMTSGCLMRSTALTALLNSAECDVLEEAMRADLAAVREVTGAKVAPAVFAYVWPAMPCYTLTEAIPKHGVRSTLSGKTLAAEGWQVPAAERVKAEAAMAKLQEVAK